MTRYGVVDIRDMTAFDVQQFINEKGKPILMNDRFLIVKQGR